MYLSRAIDPSKTQRERHNNRVCRKTDFIRVSLSIAMKVMAENWMSGGSRSGALRLGGMKRAACPDYIIKHLQDAKKLGTLRSKFIIDPL